MTSKNTLKTNTNLNLNLTLKNSLKLTSQHHHHQNSDQSKPKLNDIYLMQICGNLKKQPITQQISTIDFKLACLNSEQVITIYDENLNIQAQINDAHTDTIINEIDFYKQNKNLLLSCGDDSLVKVWDLRNTRKEILKYDLASANSDGENNIKFLSVDIDCNDEIIAASTSNTDDNNSYIYLFDTKMNNKVLKKYADAHSNDITQVKFDAFNSKRFVSASIDGLACVFDLNNFKTDGSSSFSRNLNENEETRTSSSVDEDDDLIDHVYNTNSSIQKIGYLNANNEYLYAITFTNDLFIWDLSTQDEIYKLSLYNNLKSDYIIDCFSLNSRPNEVLMCLGDKNGNIQIYDVNERLLFNTASSTKSSTSSALVQHSDIIRSIYFNYYNYDLFSVGEDGLLNKWKLNLLEKDDADVETSVGGSKRAAVSDEDKSDDSDEESDNEDEKRKNKRLKTFKSNNNNNNNKKAKKKFFNKNKRKN